MSTDRLSAYLDGELNAADRAELEAELAEQNDLRAELESLAFIRSALRDMPEVEAPDGFLTSLRAELADADTSGTSDANADDPPTNVVPLARRRRGFVARAGTAVAAVAACWLLLVGLAPGISELAPPLEDYVQASAAADPLGFDPMDVTDMDMDDAVMPNEMAGMARMAVYQRGETMRADYDAGGTVVSIFQDKGVVDWDALPTNDAEIVMMDDESPMWVGHIGASTVAVVEHDGTVITVVSDGMDAVMHVAHDLPHEPSAAQSLFDRTRSGFDRVTGWVS